MECSPKCNILVPPKVDGVSRENACLHCGKHATMHCAGCFGAKFCDVACQRAVWKKHRLDCKTAEIFGQNYHFHQALAAHIASDEPDKISLESKISNQVKCCKEFEAWCHQYGLGVPHSCARAKLLRKELLRRGRCSCFNKSHIAFYGEVDESSDEEVVEEELDATTRTAMERIREFTDMC